jgi:hypothetical protein
MASAVAAQHRPNNDRHATENGTSPSEFREMSDPNGGDIAGWIVIGAASAVLFIGVGYTNTFGVFVRLMMSKSHASSNSMMGRDAIRTIPALYADSDVATILRNDDVPTYASR